MSDNNSSLDDFYRYRVAVVGGIKVDNTQLERLENNLYRAMRFLREQMERTNRMKHSIDGKMLSIKVSVAASSTYLGMTNSGKMLQLASLEKQVEQAYSALLGGVAAPAELETSCQRLGTKVGAVRGQYSQAESSLTQLLNMKDGRYNPFTSKRFDDIDAYTVLANLLSYLHQMPPRARKVHLERANI